MRVASCADEQSKSRVQSNLILDDGELAFTGTVEVLPE